MWMSLITAIPSLLSGAFGSINKLTDAISNQKIAAINATTEQDRIRANENVLTLQARRDVMIAESAHSKLNIYIRALITIGPASLLLKVFLWDKVIGSLVGCSQAARGTCGVFTTDSLDENLWQVVMVVLGFYFLADTSSLISRMFAGKK